MVLNKSIPMQVLEKWLKLKTDGINLGKYFQAVLRGKRLALVGIADSLFLDLAREEFTETNSIVGVVDTLDMKHITTKIQSVQETVDLLLVVDFQNFFNVEKIVKNNFGMELLSIRELIDIAFLLEEQLPVLSKIAESEKVIPYILRLPILRDYEDKTHSMQEAFVRDIAYSLDQAKENPGSFNFTYATIPEYSNEYIKNVFYQPPIIQKSNWRGQKYLAHSDYKSEWVNVIQGIRLTVDQPEQYKTCIHTYGNCMIYGYGVDDRNTIPSYLQKELNEKSIETKVVNHGVWGSFFDDWIAAIQATQFEENDIVAIIGTSTVYFPNRNHMLYPFFKEVCDRASIQYIDLSSIFETRDKDEFLWIDSLHMNHKAYQKIASEFFNLCENRLIEGNAANSTKVYEKPVSKQSQVDCVAQDDEFDDYRQLLKSVRVDENKEVGSIVMNCNPFTLGHLYLIEQAAKQVDHLYIFVVEEDKSIFTFKDRMDLVKKGVAHIPNITVLPSGKYIISTITFPEYFTKDNPDGVEIDMSLDLELFAQKIAPELHITKRFAGEEPLCQTTRQYNSSMANILPKYGIEFVEVPRKIAGEEPISASRVRKLLQDQNFEEIKKIVPKSTYEYLKEFVK